MAAQKPKYILSLDWETSGSTFGSLEQTTSQYQGVSFGAVVADTETLEIVDTIYEEIQLNPKYGWSPEAEKIHGLSLAHLTANGVTQEQAAVSLGSLILKYFGNTPVVFAGHNVEFDIAFTKQLMDQFGCMFEISHRKIDTAGIGFAMFNIMKSDELYEFLGLPERSAHNALEDAIYTIESLKTIRQLMNAALGV